MVNRQKCGNNVLDSEDESTTSSAGSTPAPDTDTWSGPLAVKKSKKEVDMARFNEHFKVEMESNEAVLGAFFSCSSLSRSDSRPAEAQISTWSASCYAHFHSPLNIIVDANGGVKYQFVCKRVCYPTLFYLQTYICSFKLP